MFKESDALRALVIYTPESSQPDSSQDMFKTVPPATEVMNQDKNNKDESLTFINESAFKAPRKLKFKLKPTRMSHRLSDAKASKNYPAPNSSVDNQFNEPDIIGVYDEQAELDEPKKIEVSKVEKRKKHDQV